MAKLIVTSSSPLPRNRGGETFFGAKEFALDHFTEAQLGEIVADPVLTVVVGERLHAENLGGFSERLDEVREHLAAERAEDDASTVAEIGAAKAKGRAKA
jgi:hypothetical protein